MSFTYAHQGMPEDLSAVVFFGVGEKEVLDKNTLGIFSSTARLPEILKTRAYPSLRLYFGVFEGESHVSAIPPLLAWGLRSVWEGEVVGEARGPHNHRQAISTQYATIDHSFFIVRSSVFKHYPPDRGRAPWLSV